MKNAKMPIQGEGIIRNTNRSHIEGGVEVSGIMDILREYGPPIACAACKTYCG